MTPDDIPIYLQYGALGILVFWVTWYAKEQQKFIHNLMNKLDANAKEERADWKEFVRSSTEALVSTMSALSQIAQKMAVLQQGHDSLQQGHDKILTKLETR